MKTPKLAVLGLGSRTTAYYLEALNRCYNEKVGGYSTCPFMLLNANFDDINPLLPQPSKALDTITQAYINEIEKWDIENLLVPNITLHETIDRIKLTKNILHPLHLAVSKIKENKWSKIVLFGSLHTMESNYIPTYFKSNHIEVLLPSKEDRELIDKVRKLVYASTENEKLMRDYYTLIEKHTQNQPTVLACTELSILKPKTLSNKLIDMAQLQVETAIEKIVFLK